jgi:hypothetical protein
VLVEVDLLMAVFVQITTTLDDDKGLAAFGAFQG